MPTWWNSLRLEEHLQRSVEAGVQLFKIALLYAVVRFVIRRAGRGIVARLEGMERIAAQKPRIRTLGNLVRSTVEYTVLIIAILMALRAMGIDITPLLATAGVAGLAVGFGAQRLVRDVISGFFLLAENQFAVGEMVTIGGITGVVEEVGMRTTHLRDEQGRMVVIANGDVNLVVNHSRRGGVRLSTEVRVASSADIHTVTALLQQAAEEVCVEEPLVGVSAFDAASVTLRLTGIVPAHERERIELQWKQLVWERLRQKEIPLV
ncbi:MAG: mechanosensitive ion channel family protein [Armatimonadota bacterium]|nr:mechanosensitive ion channel family protein [bacterium]MCS7310026.1 mechanosensitive ion channel family protein [Armatimonadota bacterium]MDW8104937.1 mechanosensitive ion channel family protein [Armatimonadota bacterium]MDW8291276.1 mechanosensitive ion channel family protein [Armatimonadota bacterium]